MRRVLLLIFEVVVMLVAGVAAMFLRPFHITHVVWQTAVQRRTLELDWLIAVLIVSLLLVGIEALRKQFRVGVQWTGAALVLAVVLGFLMKLGFKTASF